MSARTGAVPVTTALLDAALGALADPLRQRTVELLAARPRRAGDLVCALGVNAPTMSKHLRVLRQGDLSPTRRPGFDSRDRILVDLTVARDDTSRCHVPTNVQNRAVAS